MANLDKILNDDTVMMFDDTLDLTDVEFHGEKSFHELDPSEWIPISTLSTLFDIGMSYVNMWLLGNDIILADYDMKRDYADVLHIHVESWQQFCEDFWFRNVPRYNHDA